MKKLVSLTPLCFLILIVGCESFMKKDYKKPYKLLFPQEKPDQIIPQMKPEHRLKGAAIWLVGLR